jgi:hypothetical protein
MIKNYLFGIIGVIVLSLGVGYAINLEMAVLASKNGIPLNNFYPLFIFAIIGFPTLLLFIWTNIHIKSQIPE